MERLLLIDSYNYIYRAYCALPKTFKDKDGNLTNAIYGFSSMLISTLNILNPTYAIAALDDTTKPVFRDADFKEYKANRKPIEPELLEQIPKIEEIIEAFGIQKVCMPTFEADDIIGTIAKKAEEEKIDVVIVSNDKDILQLLTPHIRIFIPDNKSKEGGTFFGISDFRNKYGFEPIHMIDYKSLLGDASDNIPGVFGIGEKTAGTLIQKYKTTENLYQKIYEITPESLRNKLIKGRESAFMSKRIATITTEMPIEFSKDLCKIKKVDRVKVVEILRRYNFKSLIKRMGFETDVANTKETQKEASQLSML